MDNVWRTCGNHWDFGGFQMLRQAPTKFCDFHGEAPMAAYFAAQNRNKSSVTLNYTKPEGQERCLDEGHDFGSG